MKLLDIEILSQTCLRQLPQLYDLQLANLEITIDFVKIIIAMEDIGYVIGHLNELEEEE